ncbi:hypothetical protein WMF30_13880 [Sorangium sp. So ce134]
METPTMKPGLRAYAGRLCAGACLTLLATTAGCGEPPIGEDDAGSTASSGGGGGAGSTAPSDAGTWPRTVTLTAKEIGTGDYVRLSDGTVSDAGDLGIQSAMVISLRSAAPESICERGTSFAALADVPTDVAGCSSWAPIAYLSGTTIHESDESYRIGVGLLVWDAEHVTLYRLRVLGDSYDVTAGSTATFEYEPAP